jgi:hypothetical protein
MATSVSSKSTRFCDKPYYIFWRGVVTKELKFLNTMYGKEVLESLELFMWVFNKILYFNVSF